MVDAARRFAADLPALVGVRLAIIVEELVSNLLDHAALPAQATLSLQLWVADGRLWLRLVDPAPPFDPRMAAPAPVPARGGGAGLALVRAWAEIHAYDCSPGCNTLLLSLALLE